MADKTPSTDTVQGDGASTDVTPKTAGKPIPTAAAEPAKQAVAAGTTSVRPPAPADYKMPDDYASETTFDKVKAWAEANPALAILSAAGIGVLAGRILTGMVPNPEPPTLAERVESRAKTLQKEAAKKGEVYKKEASAFAGDAGDTISEALDRAAEAIRDAAGTAGDYAEEGVEKTKDLAETVSDAVKVAISGIVAAKIDDWVDRVRK
ncbi:MAG: hypothetical protein Rubg2KO_32660 [Rubricoccaceae bacterium]